MSIEYSAKLVSASSPGEAVTALRSEVEGLFVQGWRPCGGVSVTSHDGDFYAAQAVTREVRPGPITVTLPGPTTKPFIRVSTPPCVVVPKDTVVLYEEVPVTQWVDTTPGPTPACTEGDSTTDTQTSVQSGPPGA